MAQSKRFMTQGERRSLNRLSVAAYACICVALALVMLLGVWGAYRDVAAARETELRKEIARIRSHAVRTVGRIERGLEQEPDPTDLTSVRDDPWIRRFWQQNVSLEDGRLYAAVVDSTGTIVMHSDQELEGRELKHEGHERFRTELAEDVVLLRSDDFANGRRAYDVCVPIDIHGVTVGNYHTGFDAQWFEEQTTFVRRRILSRWAIVIGGIAIIVLLSGVSLYYIAYRSAALRNVADMVQLQRVTELGQLAAGLAHEIRNPLQAIRLNLHALGNRDNGRPRLNAEEVSTIIGESNEEILRLDRLVEELVGFAKPDEAKDEDVELVEELHATIRFVSQEMQNSGVEIHTRIRDQNAFVVIDPARLRQIMLNLLMNAKEATGQGGRIDVGLVRRDGNFEIHVSDDGPGIAEDDQPHVFDPFFTTKERGTGLGLALVKRFVEEANGRIQCQSDESGTTFCISLPIAVTVGS